MGIPAHRTFTRIRYMPVQFSSMQSRRVIWSQQAPFLFNKVNTCNIITSVAVMPTYHTMAHSPLTSCICCCACEHACKGACSASSHSSLRAAGRQCGSGRDGSGEVEQLARGQVEERVCRKRARALQSTSAVDKQLKVTVPTLWLHTMTHDSCQSIKGKWVKPLAAAAHLHTPAHPGAPSQAPRPHSVTAL